MKLNLFLLFFVSLPILGQSNATKIKSLVEQERVPVFKIDTSQLYNCIIIPSEFAEELLVQPKIQAQLNTLTLVKAYYVYTRYKLNPNFNQYKLDLARFNKLNNLASDVVENDFLKWQLIEQTGCQNFTEGDTYFHGFIFVHRPLDTEENRLDEFNRINNFFLNTEANFVNRVFDPVAKQLSAFALETEDTTSDLEDQIALFSKSEFELYQFFKSSINTANEIGLKRYDSFVDFSFEVKEDGTVQNIVYTNEYPTFVTSEIDKTIANMAAWKPALKDGKAIRSTVNLSVRVSYSPTVRGMYKRDGKKPEFKGEETNPAMSNAIDTQLELPSDLNYLDPKKTSTYIALDKYMPSKKKVSLVMDVTGSMAEYIAAITSWVLSNHSEHPFTSFTFFNDGDFKPTRKKKIGSTGGIYFSGIDQDIRTTIKSAMVNGSGGERPENDVEAILTAIKEDQEADEILLLGDNWSEVRDLELLYKVNKKVTVMICGDNEIPRADYLQIAWQTGGDIIYNSQVYSLAGLKKGDPVRIGNFEYDFDGLHFYFYY